MGRTRLLLQPGKYIVQQQNFIMYRVIRRKKGELIEKYFLDVSYISPSRLTFYNNYVQVPFGLARQLCQDLRGRVQVPLKCFKMFTKFWLTCLCIGKLKFHFELELVGTITNFWRVPVVPMLQLESIRPKIRALVGLSLGRICTWFEWLGGCDGWFSCGWGRGTACYSFSDIVYQHG